MSSELLLIDLSYIAHSTFHASGPETAPEAVAKQIAVRVRQLAANHPHAAVCCDSAKSFRRELDPIYKAQRETEHREAVSAIIAMACAELKADGFPVWSADGFEADDVIATAAKMAGDMDGSALILSSDKDLLQLVSDRVTVKSLRDSAGKLTNDGALMDPAAVLAKYHVRPDQMLDYLCLVGDASDNVKGATGIGPAKAAALLVQHGTLAAVYEAMAQGQPPGMTPSMRSSLVEFRDRERFIDEATGSKPMGLAHVRTLLTLRTDAPIPFHEIATERQVKNMSASDVEDIGPVSEEELRAESKGHKLAYAQTDARDRALADVAPQTQAQVTRAINAPIVVHHQPSPEPRALVRRASVVIEPVIDVAQALDRMARLQEFCAKYLEESADGGTDGGDYGIIPGAGKKKVLLKSGADKLCDVYALADTYLILTRTEDWESGLFAYDIECRLSSRVDDSLVGSGLGSCSSFESKYRYRAAGRKCPKCEKTDTIIKGKAEYGGGWICFAKKNGCGAKFRDGDKSIEGQDVGRVENPDIVDTRNTVLKMAKKRAKIDAVIGVTRSSGIFTQDLED